MLRPARAAVLLLASAAAACGDGTAEPAARDAATPPARLPDTLPQQEGVRLSGGQVTRGVGPECARCHEDVAERFRTSGMQDALTLPSGEGSVEAGLVGTSAVDPQTGITVRFEARDGRYVQRIVYVDPAGVERGSYEFPVDLVMGSGHATRSYVTVRDGRWIELPATWYRQTGALALSPGNHFHAAAGARLFQRCVECHVGDVTPDGRRTPGTYAGPVSLGITCRRCHGEAPEHVRTERPADVVHPAHLDVDRQAELCGQCHLAAAHSVLRPGRSLARDYRPGAPLGEILGLFDPADGGAATDAGVSIGAHAERMRLSRCAAESGRGDLPTMLCTTCHDPHEGHRAGAEERVVEKGCGVCHAPADCTLPAAERGDRACASCHMATVPSSDIAHTRTTDHFIRKRPEAAPPDPEASRARFIGALAVADRPLRNVLDPERRLPGAKLLEAEAYLDAVTTAQSVLGLDAPGYVARARRLLDEIDRESPGDPDASFLRALAHLRAGDARAAAAAFRAHERAFGGDADTVTHIAWALLSLGDAAGAEAAARRALATEPYEELAGTVLAAAQVQQRRPADAVAVLADLRARLGPSEDRARRMMDTARAAGDVPRAVEAAYDLLLFRSRDARALSDAAHVLAFAARDTAQARLLFRESLRLSPDLVDALVGLARAEDAAGEAAAARDLAARAERLQPGIPEVRAILSKAR